MTMLDERTITVERGGGATLRPARALELGFLRLLPVSSPGIQVEGMRVHLPADAVAIFERSPGPVDR